MSTTPDPPKNVRVRLRGGELVPAECAYLGFAADGKHVWAVVSPDVTVFDVTEIEVDDIAPDAVITGKIPIVHIPPTGSARRTVPPPPKWLQRAGVIAFAYVVGVFLLSLWGVVFGLAGDTTDVMHWIGDILAMLVAFIFGGVVAGRRRGGKR